MIHENYKGFKIYPFLEKSDLFDDVELCNQEVDEVIGTQEGYIYRSEGMWWDAKGAISGMQYIL